MRRFLTPGSESAQWISTDGVVAFRLTRSHLDALNAAGRLPQLETLDVTEARLFTYADTLDQDVVGIPND